MEERRPVNERHDFFQQHAGKLRHDHALKAAVAFASTKSPDESVRTPVNSGVRANQCMSTLEHFARAASRGSSFCLRATVQGAEFLVNPSRSCLHKLGFARPCSNRLLVTGTAADSRQQWTTGLAVMLRHFHGGVGAARGRPADEQGNLETSAFHLASDVNHFRRAMALSRPLKPMMSAFSSFARSRIFHTAPSRQINDLVIVARQHDAKRYFCRCHARRL